MIHSEIKRLYVNQIKCSKNEKLFNVLTEIVLSLDKKLKVLNPLQKNFLIIEILNFYCFFGFSIFSSLAKRILSYGLFQKGGCDPNFTQNTLELFKGYLIQDSELCFDFDFFNDEMLCDLFFNDIFKRIIAHTPGEDDSIGLDVVDKSLVYEIRQMNIALESNEVENLKIDFFLSPHNFQLIAYNGLEKNVSFTLEKLKVDPLVIFIWRVESQFYFYEKKDERLFFIKNSNEEYENKLKALCGALFLTGYSHKVHNQKILTSNLVESSHLLKEFVNFIKEKTQPIFPILDWSCLENWSSTPKRFDEIFELSTHLGFFYKIPKSKKKFQFGLTDKGLHIMRPFAQILGEGVVTK